MIFSDHGRGGKSSLEPPPALVCRRPSALKETLFIDSLGDARAVGFVIRV